MIRTTKTGKVATVAELRDSTPVREFPGCPSTTAGPHLSQGGPAQPRLGCPGHLGRASAGAAAPLKGLLIGVEQFLALLPLAMA
ncbi:hypothetical protein [Streptomyces sp. NPDC048442]|uniref:hypothetical protein n=1 Tax=Streptomyces sp. NPDC048442 TaxID=3154823 RepID=UPI003443A7A0